MAGKIKKRLSRRAQERLNRQLRAFDLAMLGVGITTAASGIVCAFGSTALDRPGAAGFAFWYIVVQSCLPMGILNGARALFGSSAFSPAADGPGFLTAAVLIWDFVLWAVLRAVGKHNNKSSILHICTKFALVVFFWGCFQLLCAVVTAGWNRGGAVQRQPQTAETSSAQAKIEAKTAKTSAPAEPKH